MRRDGNVFIADGYRNARILEYSADGKKLREWGSAGTGPGPVPPAALDPDGRRAASSMSPIARTAASSGSIATASILGEWAQYGKTFGLTLVGDAMWLSTIPRGPNSAPGWLIKVDRDSGKLLGYVDAAGNHGMDVMPNGDLLQAPGPEQIPQHYRSKS